MRVLLAHGIEADGTVALTSRGLRVGGCVLVDIIGMNFGTSYALCAGVLKCQVILLNQELFGDMMLEVDSIQEHRDL